MFLFKQELNCTTKTSTQNIENNNEIINNTENSNEIINNTENSKGIIGNTETIKSTRDLLLSKSSDLHAPPSSNDPSDLESTKDLRAFRVLSPSKPSSLAMIHVPSFRNSSSIPSTTDFRNLIKKLSHSSPTTPNNMPAILNTSTRKPSDQLSTDDLPVIHNPSTNNPRDLPSSSDLTAYRVPPFNSSRDLISTEGIYLPASHVSLSTNDLGDPVSTKDLRELPRHPRKSSPLSFSSYSNPIGLSKSCVPLSTSAHLETVPSTLLVTDEISLDDIKVEGRQQKGADEISFDNLDVEVRQHKQSIPRKRKFHCVTCGFSTKHRASLQQHMLIHNDEKLFKCGKCSFRSNYKRSMNCHIKIHDDFSRDFFTCDVCFYKTRNKPNMDYHMIVHIKAQIFKYDL